jgi:hypothetical protein
MKNFNSTWKLSMILLIASSFTIALSCSDDDDIKGKAPSIVSFTPVSSLPGASVTISGTNFSPTLADNQVSFNGVASTVTSATATELVVTVPESATTGKITVRVNGSTATSSADFTVLQTTLAGFSPESGTSGTTVVISGANFSPTLSENIVKFNGVVASVSAGSTGELVVAVPETATTGKVSVTVNGKTATSSADFIVLQTTIAGFSPESGTHGAQVIITGTNFSINAAENIVAFNGVAATVSAATSTQLTASVPAGATSGKITVTINGKTTTSAATFTVPAPAITSYFPPIAAPGISVVITGANFSSVTENNIVKFNGEEATVTAASSTQLTVTVPAAATTGPLSVKVGTSTATASNNFEICNGSAELVISDLVLSNTSGASSYMISFRITNTGAADADLTKMVMQNYASTDQMVGNDVAASGFSLTSGPTLSPGQSYNTPVFACSISGGNTTSHPYLFMNLTGSVSECNVENTKVIVPFN